ncbi:hypothetical protein [Vagococcus sp. WN89Y]|uniref:hypothetical protein n=1 Tax=Vagococcus sp. WN89Y TaxID=3457258 RepID=UPI003FCC3048
MFEIKNDDALFRFSFIERIEEPEDRRQDLIMCWLEVAGSGISLECKCEFSLFDLEEFRDKLHHFYQLLSTNQAVPPIVYAPRTNTFQCDIRHASDADVIGFNFKITPDMLTRWTVEGGTLIDQSYFPDLIAGIDSILTN